MVVAMREVIEISGVSHGTAPIPMGAKIGNIVYSSAIMGKIPGEKHLPQDPERQITQLFLNIHSFMKKAGGTSGHIIQMSVYLKDNSLRELFNQEWVRMFPDPRDRPARHITIVDLRNGMQAQVEIVAVL